MTSSSRVVHEQSLELPRLAAAATDPVVVLVQVPVVGTGGRGPALPGALRWWALPWWALPWWALPWWDPRDPRDPRDRRRGPWEARRAVLPAFPTTRATPRPGGLLRPTGARWAGLVTPPALGGLGLLGSPALRAGHPFHGAAVAVNTRLAYSQSLGYLGCAGAGAPRRLDRRDGQRVQEHSLVAGPGHLG